MTEMPAPNDCLRAFMTQNKIMLFWPQVYEKLGVTSIAELQYLGTKNVQQYLAGVPALPAIKLAELAGTKEETSDISM